MNHKPLVSIIIYNYNYGSYLKECFESAFNQTYENFEVLFSDNDSTDNSWEIALEYNNKYPEKMSLFKNRNNYGTDANLHNCWINCKGEFFVVLCSDDVFEIDFLEKTVSHMINDNNVGFVLTHRSIIDEKSKIKHEMPFYNKNCKIHPPGQNSVYMMAAVNPSISQVIYRTSLIDSRSETGTIASRHYGTRIIDFKIALEFSIVYLKEPLLRHRLHGLNENLRAAGNLMEIVGFHSLNIYFSEMAMKKGYTEVSDRLPEATTKVANLAIRYAIRSLINDDSILAKKYLNLGLSLSTELEESSHVNKINEYLNQKSPDRIKLIKQSFIKQNNLIQRSISYDPPEPFEVV